MRKKQKFVDEWLWIPYAIFINRLKGRRYRAADIEKYRERVRLAQRRLRLRVKEEPRNRLIRAIYWHEVNRPTVPIRQYK